MDPEHLTSTAAGARPTHPAVPLPSPIGSYLIVVTAPAHRLDRHRFAIESAFAGHLRLLRRKLGPLGERMTLLSPAMDAGGYERARRSLTVIDEAREGIHHSAAFPDGLGRVAYLLRAPGVLGRIFREVRAAHTVHATTSTLYRPFELPALLLGKALGKTTVFVTDIDARRSARMRFETGQWNARQYLVTRLLHDSWFHLQHTIAVRAFSLVLLKGEELARDYGRGRRNVHAFLDAAFGAEQIIDGRALAEKIARTEDPRRPLRAGYFGRLVPYKGVDHMLRAVRLAVDAGAQLRFEILGDGPQLPALRALAGELRLEDRVAFRGAVPFGPGLFKILHELDLLLAAPLSEDTPRSVLDAMASGQGVVAYDTYYYRDLAGAGAGVELVPWPRAEHLGEAVAALSTDRQRLSAMMRQNVEFARRNTQDVWLERRVRWTLEAARRQSVLRYSMTARRSASVRGSPKVWPAFDWLQ